MKALVNYSDRKGSIELREVKRPVPGHGQVLVRVKAAGVCGSDLHLWQGPVSWVMRRPVVIGHEYAGIIEETGPGVEGWMTGDRVTGETAASICGVCVYCRTGNYNVCPHRKGFGTLFDGAMAEYMVVRQGILHRVPEGLSFEEAALTEPAAVAFNAVLVKSRPVPGDLIVIIGPGTIGLMALQMALLCSPAKTVVIGLSRDERRLELASRLGADAVIRSDKESPGDTVRALGDGLGAHLVVDAAGFASTVRQSMELVRPNGQITKIGWDAKGLDISLDPLVAKAAAIQGTFSHTWETWERILALEARKRIELGSFAETYPLDQWETAFAEMSSLRIAKAVLRVEG